jgi:hypothetical protein
MAPKVLSQVLFYPVAQSICIHFSLFENMGRFVTLKKSGPKYGLQKAGCKKQGHCYSKREEARLSFLFLNDNDPVFCTLFFAPCFLHPIFWTQFF